ncbi:MAG: HAMP domain-containing sensor histidine kinase [Methyloceanibacter sp.]
MPTDREALEHIARALKGRVLRGPGAGVAVHEPSDLEELGFTLPSLKSLLEAMPAAIGVLAHGDLAHANAAFAYAFGYRSFAEMADAGGIEAIIPCGEALFKPEADAAKERSVTVDALTRGRRRLKLSFELHLLDAEAGLQLLRLIDQTSADRADAAAAQVPDDQGHSIQTSVQEAGPSPAETALAARRLDFLAKVSHEVRTPLNSILGFTELMLQERLGPIGNARYKGYMEDIHQSGLYALSLLNDLLDISKIEAGKFELDFTAVELPELVEDCVNSLQPLAKRERILLRTSFAANLPHVIADPRRLKQILLNLLSNAIKFTPMGGQVIVSGTMIEGGELRLRVRDSGVGMTKDEVALAMQPFHQLDTAPRNQTGTGLGLPLTKAMVDANRARLELASARGVGTSADVVFPPDRLVAPTASGGESP